MKHMVSYKLKPERVAENERLASDVYEALREARPAGLRYATFRLGDGVSFVHIVSHDEPDGTNALTLAAGVQGVLRRHQGALRRAAGAGRAEGDRIVWLLLRLNRAPRRRRRLPT